MTQETHDQSDDLDFETAYNTLEQLVTRMEQSDQTLEKSLADFEQGIRLINFCHQQLREAEQRVKVLTDGAEGRIEEQPFNTAELNRDQPA